jgi:hypothetical protein
MVVVGLILGVVIKFLLKSIGIDTDFLSGGSSSGSSDDYSGIGSDLRWERKCERERQDKFDKRIQDIWYGDDD